MKIMIVLLFISVIIGGIAYGGWQWKGAVDTERDRMETGNADASINMQMERGY